MTTLNADGFLYRSRFPELFLAVSPSSVHAIAAPVLAGPDYKRIAYFPRNWPLLD